MWLSQSVIVLLIHGSKQPALAFDLLLTLWTEARNSVLISIQGYDSFDFSNNSGTSDVAVDESVLDEKSFSVV